MSIFLRIKDLELDNSDETLAKFRRQNIALIYPYLGPKMSLFWTCWRRSLDRKKRHISAILTRIFDILLIKAIYLGGTEPFKLYFF